MNYPSWDFPHIGSGWVVGLIAIFHVMISHFAIGGGLYLPVAEWRALKTGRREWFDFLQAHSKFFLILTGVYGAASGVGIWFAIGLASPEATSSLIHNFVFVWAIEWTFFAIELTSAAVYYYTWGRIDEQLHLKVGWVYAAASFMTLFIINGILAFMLTPSQAWLEVAGTGKETTRLLAAFFNPTYWPSLALRTLVCVSLAGVWALVTASRIDVRTKAELKEDVVRWSVRWLFPAFFLMPLCVLWYVHQVPEGQRQLLQLGVSTVGPGSFSLLTRAVLVSTMASATILATAYLAAYRRPQDFGLGYACAIVFLALAATGSTEHAREMLRKPYLIRDYLYCSGVRKVPVAIYGTRMTEVEYFNQHGYLSRSPWYRLASPVRGQSPERADVAPSAGAERPAVAQDEKTEAPGGAASGSAAPTGSSKTSSPKTSKAVKPTAQQLLVGELMFRGQCMACHTRHGYRSITRLMGGRDLQAIRNILAMLHEMPEGSPYRSFMPPLVGTPEEIESLALYLNSLVNRPKEGNESSTAAAQ